MNGAGTRFESGDDDPGQLGTRMGMRGRRKEDRQECLSYRLARYFFQGFQ